MSSQTNQTGTERRGSALLVVIFTLVFLSLLTLIYVSIGRSDWRLRRAISGRNEETPEKMRDYIAQIIADDALSVQVNQIPRTVRQSFPSVLGNLPPTAYRETTDYPYVLPDVFSLRTQATSDKDFLKFNPTGDFSAALENYNSRTFPEFQEAILGPSDPWLAPTAPTDLNPEDGPNPAELRPGDQPELRLPFEAKDAARDWASITNIAPDGLFVNLFALRGNFTAQAGFESSQLSRDLSLIKSDRQDYGDPEESTLYPEFSRDALNPDQKNQPFYWTMRQKNAFRPARISPVDARFSSPDYKGYQWADADGDGMLDSRWFQATDSSEGETVEVLGSGGVYRFFYAARIVDLSSLINVNTAGDASTGGEREAKFGLPSDVDLTQALSNLNVYDRFGLGYEALRNRLEPTGEYRYVDQMPEYYGKGEWSILDDGYGVRESGMVGKASAMALQVMRGSQSLLVANDSESAIKWKAGQPFGEYVERLASAAAPIDPIDAASERAKWDFDAKAGRMNRRLAFYNYARQNYAEGDAIPDLDGNPNSRAYNFFGQFGLESTIELNIFRGLNRIENLSGIEQAMAGRLDFLASTESQQGSVRFCPLRSNRPETELEYIVDQAIGDGSLTPDGRPDLTDLLHSRVDLRSALTTINGARLLRSSSGVLSDFLNTNEVKSSADELLRPMASRLDDAAFIPNPDPDFYRAKRREARAQAIAKSSQLFRDYTAILDGIPRTESQAIDQAIREEFVWPNPVSNDPLARDAFDTAFYGGRGAPRMIRAAAHMAINALDMRDMDRPYILDSVLDGTGYFETIEPAFGQLRVSTRLGADPAAPRSANVVRLEVPARLEAPGNYYQDIECGQLRLYGIEPQPFVAQVAVFTTYADLPTEDGGVEENNSPTGPVQPATIAVGTASDPSKNSNSTNNNDFMYRILAFKLVNPFGTPIDSNYLRTCFIRYAGRTYRIQPPSLRGVDSDPLLPVSPSYTIPPLSPSYSIPAYGSRVFYVMFCPDRATRPGQPAGLPSNSFMDRAAKRLPSWLPVGGGARVFPTIAEAKEAIEASLGGITSVVGVGSLPSMITPVGADFRESDTEYDSDFFKVLNTDVSNGTEVQLWRISDPRAVLPNHLDLTVDGTPTNPDSNDPFGPVVQPLASDAIKASNQLLDRMKFLQGSQVLNNGTKLADSPGGSAAEFQIPITLRSESNRPRMITLYASFSRPVDPAIYETWYQDASSDPDSIPAPTGPFGVPDGALPAYCLETKLPLLSQDPIAGGIPWNFKSPASVPATSLSSISLTVSGEIFGTTTSTTQLQSGRFGGESFNNWAQKARRTDNLPLESMAMNPAFPRVPQDFIGPCPWVQTPAPVATGPEVRSITYFELIDSTTAQSRGRARAKVPGTQLFNMHRITLPGYRADRTGNTAQGDPIPARPGDLLMPLAMGPAFNYAASPTEQAGRLPGFDNEIAWRWATLGETAAAVLGFVQLDAGGVFDPDDPIAIYQPDSIPVTATLAQDEYHLDRGQLRLDRYVPFIDRNSNGTFQPYSSSTPSGDVPLGKGAPLAMGVFDYFHGFTQPSLYEFSAESLLTRSIPGVVNISTATGRTLESLPGLAPPGMPSRALNYPSDVNAPVNEIQRLTFSRQTNDLVTLQVSIPGIPTPFVTRPVSLRSGGAMLQEELNRVLPDYCQVRCRTSGPTSIDVIFIGRDVKGQNISELRVAGSGAASVLVATLVEGRRGSGPPSEDLNDIGNPGWYDAAGLPGSVLSSQTDIATTLLAYRDKNARALRRSSSAMVTDDSGDQRWFTYIDFDDRRLKNQPFLPGEAPPDSPINFGSRRRVSGIPAMNEHPGFRSIGELIGVRVRNLVSDDFEDFDPAELTGSRLSLRLYPRINSAPFNIDFPGYDVIGGSGTTVTETRPRIPAEFDVPGMVLDYYQSPAPVQTAGTRTVAYSRPAVANSYDEQMLLINALADTVTTRSDIYIAWFVVHGYTQLDCQIDPASETPLTPSIARRFIMIVDRSNVVRRGDPPNILHFQEVPYAPFQ